MRVIKLNFLISTTFAGVLMSAGFPVNSVTFTDVTDNIIDGKRYQRTPSKTWSIVEEMQKKPTVTTEELIQGPAIPHGFPGIAVFDYDRDGDLDLYVTNGPGSANSLYENQLVQIGKLSYVDVASKVGVTATEHNSTGVCFGDTDNDGDHDLLVLGDEEENIFYENMGSGSFEIVTNKSNLGGGALGSSSCSMGDINNDGLLDIAIVNTGNKQTFMGGYIVPFALNHPNQLYLNSGDNIFIDVSETSGFRVQKGLAPEHEALPTVTHAVAMVDYDLDGDLDIITADDQVLILPAVAGGVDRGIIHVFKNDGTGKFDNISDISGTAIVGGWMGLSFGDINCDKNMDFFATNAGDQVMSLFTGMMPFMSLSSRWFLGTDENTFLDPGVGSFVDIPFGWGTSMSDFDNDGDTDIVFYGGLRSASWVVATNPGTLLFNNECSGSFTYERETLKERHARRNVHGQAIGDLNNDGYSDIVSVSNFDSPEETPMLPTGFEFGSVFDEYANYIPLVIPTSDPNVFTWTKFKFLHGSLSIELNSADNGNNWVKVSVIGSKDITSQGYVNRDGIGAVIQFTPKKGKPVMHPILGGSSHLSQDSLTITLGLGEKKYGDIEVLWPGGVRNRIYKVKKNEHIVIPEIPCSYDSDMELLEYKNCVKNSLNELVDAGIISNKNSKKRFYKSAMKAYRIYNEDNEYKEKDDNRYKEIDYKQEKKDGDKVDENEQD